MPSLFGPDPEPPVTAVRGTDGGSWYAIPSQVIPERGQVGGDDIKSSNKDRCHVLHENVSGSQYANGVREVRPERRPFTVDDAGALTGDADVLAREAPTDDVDTGSTLDAAAVAVEAVVGVFVVAS